MKNQWRNDGGDDSQVALAQHEPLASFLCFSLDQNCIRLFKSDALAAASALLAAASNAGTEGISPLCHSPAASGPAKGEAPFWASLGPSLLHSPPF